MARVALGMLLGALMAQAEVRTFTSVDGRKVEGELLSVEDTAAVVTAWWEENKNNVGPMDIRAQIDRDTDRVDRAVTRPKGGVSNKPTANQVTKKHTIDDFNYTCTLKNFTHKNISGLTAEYTIYKRVIGRDKSGLSNKTEEITGEKSIPLLEAMGNTTFNTVKVKCEDTSESGGKGPMVWKRETILGIVVTLSVGGKEIVKQSDPDNLLDRLEEAEKREDSRD